MKLSINNTLFWSLINELQHGEMEMTVSYKADKLIIEWSEGKYVFDVMFGDMYEDNE